MTPERKQLVVLCIVAIATLAIPVVYPSPYLLRLMVLIFIYSILTMSLNVLAGYAGMISLGHAAFFGLGAYTTAVMSAKMGLPFVLCFFASALVPPIIAAVYGAIVLRSLRYIYFTLASWGLLEILNSIYLNVSYLGGPNGIRGIQDIVILGIRIGSDIPFFYFSFVFAALTLISCELLVLSRVGRAWTAIRENEVVAGVMGIKSYRYQLLAFVISSCFAGIAGSLYAYYESFISPVSFSVWESIFLFCMLLVGGRRSLIGSVVGTAIFVLLPEVLRGIGDYRMIIYGVVLLVVIMFKPAGLIPQRFIILGMRRS